MKRKLIKFSNYSFCITLPKQAVDAFGWKKGQSLNVNFERGSKLITVTSLSGNKKSRSQTKSAKPQKAGARTKPQKSDGVKPIPELRW